MIQMVTADPGTGLLRGGWRTGTLLATFKMQAYSQKQFKTSQPAQQGSHTLIPGTPGCTVC